MHEDLAKRLSQGDYVSDEEMRTAVPRLIKMVEDREREILDEEKYRAETEIERDKIGNRLGDAKKERDAAIAEVARIGAELGKAQAEADRLRAALATIRDRNTTYTTGEGHAGAIAIARAALGKD